MGPYFIPLARRTGRFFVDFIRCFGCWFPAFRKPSWGNRPTSSCRSFKAGRSHPVRPVLGEEEFLFFISGICYMLSVSQYQWEIKVFLEIPCWKWKKVMFGDWEGAKPAKFFHVSYFLKNFTSQREGKILTSHQAGAVLPVKKAVRGRASSAIRWRIK